MICPRCQARYPEDWQACPTDATRLLASLDLGPYRIVAVDPDHADRYRGTAGGVSVTITRLDAPDRSSATAEIVARVQALATINHPSIHRVLDVIVEGHVFVVTETLAGHTLEDELRFPEPIAVPRLHYIMAKILDGLVTAHAAGVVHRMIRTSTIVLARTPDGEVPILCDFDLAYLIAAARPTLAGGYDRSRFTTAMAPELVLGRHIGAPADVYGIAAIVYQRLLGRPLFAGEVFDLLASILNDPIPALADDAEASPELAALLRRGLARDQALRPAAAELQQALHLIAPRVPPKALLGAPDILETSLLSALRTDPADQATRQVYADWLEERGYATRATFLRLDAIDDELRSEPALAEVALPTDAAWRAITSRAPIARCVTFAFACPKRWDALTPTGTDNVRHCAACSKPVYFCTTVDEARAHGAKRECVAVDAALTRTAAESAYDAATRPRSELPIMMGKMPPPPGPIPIPPPPPTPIPIPIAPTERPGLLGRLKGWFTGR